MPYEPPKNGFRTFIFLWLTQSVSVIGTALTVFAINIWLVQVAYPLPEQQPQLAGALSAFNLCFGIPVMLTTPLAGAWADRHDRKQTMLVTDLLSGGMSLLLMFFMLTDRLTLPVLLPATVLFSMISAFHGSAFDTSYAMLVEDKRLPRANAMMQTMWSLSNIISPALAAFLISMPALARQGVMPQFLAGLSNGAPLAIGLDALSFFLAAAVLPFLVVPSPKRKDLDASGKPRKSMLADIREGAVYIWRRRPMLWLLGTFAVVNLCSPFGVLMPLLVKFNLAADWSVRGFTLETAMALLNTFTGIGGLAAGVVISAWGGLKNRRVYGVVVPLLLAGLIQMGIGSSTLLYLTTAFSFLLTAVIPMANVHSQAIWQSQTPRELQGRVFAVRRVIAQCLGPIGIALAGWLAGAHNPGTVLTVMGAIVAVVCFLQLFNPHLLRVDNKEYLDDLAARAAAGDD